MELLLILVQKMSVVATVAYFLSNLPAARRLLNRPPDLKVRLYMIVVFGLFGILGTYTGVNIHGAIANNRIIGVAIGGLLGGPLVGLGAGLLAGIHRWFLGGFTAVACGLSTTLEGLLCGLIHNWQKGRLISWPGAFGAGVVSEMLQMLIILLVARPFTDAFQLVRVIGLPMILSNAAGVAIFVAIIRSVRQEQERSIACQAKQVLDIADQTLPYLKKGLNHQTAQAAARIILAHAGIGAVAITDLDQVLAHAGAGDDHHRPGQSARLTGMGPARQPYVTQRPEICAGENCPLAAAVVVPLYQGDHTIGSLVLYQTGRHRITRVEIELASGLAKLFSTQLELAQVDHQAQLAARAEIKALQAQINPHFLFNALNTILCYVRRNPETARSLISRLGEYFRQNLDNTADFVLLAKEIEHVRAYLAIEEARFEDRLSIEFAIEPQCNEGLLPPLILQPLVENAVKHGIFPKKGRGTLHVAAARAQDDLLITVEDDGVGMDPVKLQELTGSSGHPGGIGFANVNERMAAIYGESYRLRVDSVPGGGTRVFLRLPFKKTG